MRFSGAFKTRNKHASTQAAHQAAGQGDPANPDR